MYHRIMLDIRIYNHLCIIKLYYGIEAMFCFETPFLKMILNESQTICLFLIIY
jgi:hypothetical protein